MSDAQSGGYTFDLTGVAKEQIGSAAALATQAGKLQDFVAILKKAVQLMQTDPHGWGIRNIGRKRLTGLFTTGYFDLWFFVTSSTSKFGASCF